MLAAKIPGITWMGKQYDVIRDRLRNAKIYSGGKKALGDIWHREHDVRAHFCHDKIARQNGHRLKMGDTPQTHEPAWSEIHVNSWKCTRCGGRRWHKETHKRGTKNHGRVRTSYEVKG